MWRVGEDEFGEGEHGDEEPEVEEGEEGVDAEGQLHSAFKLRAMSRSPYARTVYLDKDTRVCASLTGAFDLLPRYDFVATQAAAAFYEGGPDPWSEDSGLHPVPPAFIQFCAAVIFYRRSARVAEVSSVASVAVAL